jgi:hypothetical protein
VRQHAAGIVEVHDPLHSLEVAIWSYALMKLESGRLSTLVMNWLKQGFVFVVPSSLVLATTQAGRADEVEQSMAQTGQQSPEKLDQVVAPIALYPEALVAQILTVSTHPGEVVEADRWLQQYAAWIPRRSPIWSICKDGISA